MKKTTYIVLEGSEGTGKSTQAKLLIDSLRNQGYSVLETKEPGTVHSPLTLELRKIMLDAKYEDQMTVEAREYVSQAIRSIHLNKVIYPNLGQYDFIIQDRGVLSGMAYGVACGNALSFIKLLSDGTIGDEGKKRGIDLYNLYDHIIVFQGSIKKGLERATSAKKEFEAGDAMENKGVSFLEVVNQNFESFSKFFKNVHFIDIETEAGLRSIEEVQQEILKVLELE